MPISLSLSREQKRKLIIDSIKYRLLNELFSETLSDLPQRSLIIRSESELQPHELARKISGSDIIVTNSTYAKDMVDFQVIDSSGEVILTVSPDGQYINHISQETYAENEDELEKLFRLYERLCDSDVVFIPAEE